MEMRLRRGHQLDFRELAGKCSGGSRESGKEEVYTSEDKNMIKKNLLIMVENSYKGKLVKGRGEELRTTKTDKDNHGIGLSSVRRVVGKYHGTVSIDDSIPECFAIRVVLYGE